MIFRPSREGGDDRFLHVKTGLLVTGAAIGIFGMVSDRDYLVYTAIAVLAVGVILRLIKQRLDDRQS
jgi:hypothetical protein